MTTRHYLIADTRERSITPFLDNHFKNYRYAIRQINTGDYLIYQAMPAPAGAAAVIRTEYRPQAAPLLKQPWEYTAQSVEAYPWDTTYLIGPMGLDRHWDGSHDWEPANIPNATWDTPIWKANRRAKFMLTQDKTAHPWFFEDAALRLEDSAALGFKAVGFFDQAIAIGGPKVADIRTQREIVWKTARSLRAKGLHFQLTLAAQRASTRRPRRRSRTAHRPIWTGSKPRTMRAAASWALLTN